MSDAPILSYSMVSRALTDKNFYAGMPEFSAIKPKLQAMQIDIARPSGCSGCQQKRVASNLFKDFLFVVQTLDTAALSRLKGYFKIDKLMINTLNPTTGGVEFKVI